MNLRRISRLFASSVLVTGLAAAAIACSSTDAGSTPEGACSTYADAYRSYTQKCSTTLGTSVSDARWQHLESRMKAACGSALTLPGTAITPAALTVCANAIRSASCNSDFEDLPQCEFEKG